MPRLRRPTLPVHLLVRQVAAVTLLAVAVFVSLRPDPAPVGGSPATTVPVVVAADDLPAGATLGTVGLAVVRLPPDARPAGSFSEAAPLSGRVLAAPVRSGEPVTDVRLVGAGVTALLPPGQVAAPVRLADLAVAALVRSGDRIDVLATAEGSTTAEVVAENALVLAASDPVSTPVEQSASEGLLLVAVEPEIAARLAAAAASATLTIVLPPP